MRSTKELFLESADFFIRVFEDLRKSDPGSAATFMRLLSQEGAEAQIVVKILGGNPVVSCFAVIDGNPVLVGSESLSPNTKKPSLNSLH